MTPSEESLCILQPLRDHEYTGIWDLSDRNLKKATRLAAIRVLLLFKYNYGNSKALKRKKVPVVEKILHGSLIFLTTPVLLALEKSALYWE
jgi:hypothetical protein